MITDVKVQYRVTWFPPDAPQRRKTTSSKRAARNLLRTEDENGQVPAEWNPIIEEIITTVEASTINPEDIA